MKSALKPAGRRFVYREHEVRVQATQRNGVWFWAHAIEGKPGPESKTGAVSEDVAMLEARHDAERRIDLMLNG